MGHGRSREFKREFKKDGGQESEREAKFRPLDAAREYGKNKE